MASSIGGRRFRERMPADETVERAEQRAAVKRARVSPGASQSGVNSSGDKAVRAVFCYMVTKLVMEISTYYLKQELLTEPARNEIVLKVVEKIVERESGQIPQTEKLMEQYISKNKQNIKKLVKDYVERFW